MIHYVISQVDRGEPIVVRNIKCKTPETLEELSARIHGHEHELILEGTAMAIHNLWEKRSKSMLKIVISIVTSLTHNRLIVQRT